MDTGAVVEIEMKAESEQELDRFWAYELGMDSGLANAPRICCTVQHIYSGVQLFRNSEQLVVASPPSRAEFIQDALTDGSAEELFSVEWLQRVLSKDAEKILGPAEVHYADETTFRSARIHSARALSASDSVAHKALVAALDPGEVEDSGISAQAAPAFGAFCDDRLCAVASYEVWKPSIAHITVAIHPDYRRRGFAKAAVGALAADALDRGLILQWRAVAWNKNSLAVARDLGFKYYCSTLYVRLRDSG